MSQIRVNEVVSENSTGSPNFPNGVVVSGVATFANDVSVAGTITYQDVTDVSAVGIITANAGIEVAGIITAKAGAAVTYYGDGSNLTGITATAGIGIQSGGITVGTGVTQLNFVGTGNSITLNGDTVDISISGSGGGGSETAVVVADPFLLNDNGGYHPAELSGDGSVVSNATLQARRWYLNDNLIVGAAGTQLNSTGVGTYKYEERWVSDSTGSVLLADATQELIEVELASPTIISPSDGQTGVVPFNPDGSATISLVGSVPNITNGAVTSWGTADWQVAEDNIFATNLQSQSIAISDPTVGQTGPTFTYLAGKTYYIRLKYNVTDPSGQGPFDYSTTQDFTTAAATYSISGPSAVDEGTTESYTVTTAHVLDGTTFYWNTTNASDFDPAEGTVTVNTNTGTFNLSIKGDNTTEGTESFQLRLYSDSARTNLVYTSSLITINDTSIDPLWNWPLNQTYTFTNLGATGPNGPTQSTISSSANGTNYATFLDSPADGIQRLTIPRTGTYSIKVRGAAGGDGQTKIGGKGVEFTVEGGFAHSQKILIVVGQKGNQAPSHGAGGGGGTFVYLENSSGYDQYQMTDIVAAAGGGAGANDGESANGNGMDAVTTIVGGYGRVDPTNQNAGASTNTWTRPAPGYSGLYELYNGSGRNYAGGVGAGFYDRRVTPADTNIAANGVYSYYQATVSPSFNTGNNGAVTTTNDCNETGSAFPGNSGRQGEYSSQPSFNESGNSGYAGPWVGGRAADPTIGSDGGFGGGGGGANNCGGSGSGGGFSGGMAAGCSSVSGGGGSYGRVAADGFGGWSITGAMQVSNNTSHGVVEITRVA